MTPPESPSAQTSVADRDPQDLSPGTSPARDPTPAILFQSSDLRPRKYIKRVSVDDLSCPAGISSQLKTTCDIIKYSS